MSVLPESEKWSSLSCSSAACSLSYDFLHSNLAVNKLSLVGPKNGMPLWGDAILSYIRSYERANKTEAPMQAEPARATCEATRTTLTTVPTRSSLSYFSAWFPACCRLISCGSLSILSCLCDESHSSLRTRILDCEFLRQIYQKAPYLAHKHLSPTTSKSTYLKPSFFLLMPRSLSPPSQCPPDNRANIYC